MGTIIKSTAISTIKDNYSSNEHAVEACNKCIETAGIAKEDIDIIINVGVYRDDNMLEPAMAAFVQKGTGIKGDYMKSQGYNAAFSFDLMNSSCGILNAIQTADAILRSRNAKYALIASSDTHPSNRNDKYFPYSCVGSAMILQYVEDESRGFSNFSFNSTKTSEKSSTGYLDFDKIDEPARERLTINIPEDYHKDVLEFAGSSLKDYISKTEIDKDNVKLITPQINDGFGKNIAAAAEINDDSVLDLYTEYGDAHSSALTMSYHLRSEKDQFKENDQVLFVAAGAGLTSGCAMYTV